jgi:hypothetical protein
LWPTAEKIASSYREDQVRTNDDPTPSFMRAMIVDQILEEDEAGFSGSN